jgi:hypothetical protein
VVEALVVGVFGVFLVAWLAVVFHALGRPGTGGGQDQAPSEPAAGEASESDGG